MREAMGRHWIFIAVVGILAGRGLSARSSPADCDNMEIIKCLQSTQNDGQLFFPDTQQKLNEYCDHLMTGLNCARNLINNCVNEIERAMYHNLTKDMVGMNEALCTPRSSLSSRFLKHVNCYKSVSERFRRCSDRYIGNIVVVQSLSQEEQMGMTCCTVNEYNRCMRNAVEDRPGCEADAQKLVEETVVTALKQSIGYCKQLGDIPTSNCMEKYSPGSGQSEQGNLSGDGDGSEQISTSTTILVLGLVLALLLT